MRKFYSLLGLCKRANKVAGGEVAAEEAIRGKKACLVIVAGDASANTKKKFHNSASFYEVPILELGTKADLGRAVGEEIRAVLVVTEAGFAAKLQQLAQTAENAESVSYTHLVQSVPPSVCAAEYHAGTCRQKTHDKGTG